MARTIAEIQAQMDNEQALQSSLSDLNSPSKVAIYTLWKYVVSASIWAHEKLWDIFKSELESIVDITPTSTPAWLKARVLEFQYSATIPQTIIVDPELFTLRYGVIDPSLRIITRVSVKTLPSRIVSVKVAANEPPTALTAPQLVSLNGYLDSIAPIGVQYVASSANADKLYLSAEIFYNGQYSAVISANVIGAIKNYLANIPFDGNVRVASVTDAIQSVEGVTDVVITEMAVRDDLTAWSGRVKLVDNKQTIYNKYPTIAGYIVEETTVDKTFVDRLTFTAE